jgi:hypothetical protein
MSALETSRALLWYAANKYAEAERDVEEYPNPSDKLLSELARAKENLEKAAVSFANAFKAA